MRNPEISVIIPAYNVGAYLSRALDSLRAQLFKDFEAIVVNDGSTDDTGNMCEHYAALDKRFTVIHTQNSGAPAARNTAIAISTGKYLYFMDADDWAEPGLLKSMYELAEQTNAQLVVTGFCIDTEYGNAPLFRQQIFVPNAIYSTAADFRLAATPLFDKNLLYPPWNKLYLASRIREMGLRFRNTRWDDFPFNLDYIRDVERVAVHSGTDYHFMRARAESETTRYYPGMFEKREEEHVWLLELYEYWNIAKLPASREFLARRYIERVFGVVENTTCSACPLTKKQQRHTVLKILSSPYVAWSLRYAKPRSFMMRCMLIPIRLHSACLTYLLGKTISFVKSKQSRLFAKLKARR